MENNNAKKGTFYVFAVQGPAFGQPEGDVVSEKANSLRSSYEPAADMDFILVRPSSWNGRVDSSNEGGILRASYSLDDNKQGIRDYLTGIGVDSASIDEGLRISDEKGLQLSNPFSGVFVMGVPIASCNAAPAPAEASATAPAADSAPAKAVYSAPTYSSAPGAVSAAVSTSVKADEDSGSGKMNGGYLAWAIANIIFGSWLFGLIALIATIGAKNAATEDEEEKKLKNARTYNIIATVIGAIVIIISLSNL